MRLIYIDESMDGSLQVLSGLVIKDTSWQDAYKLIKDFRLQLNRQYGIYVRKEMHATKWVSGRGRIANRHIPLKERCNIFNDTLRLVTNLPDAMLFNAAFDKKNEDRGFERLINRINRAMVDCGDVALLVCDEGKEGLYTPLCRKLRAYNPVQSKFGGWAGVPGSTKNIPAMRIIEDPMFIRSDRSVFIQLVDFCAYSLLRSEAPIPSKTKLGLDKSFNILDPILVKKAFANDPRRLGIIRDT